ncbi:hypothetical protein WA1_31310 [Scytonema hofmannii PCC 7110]|uniref:Uncharacterized protein n=1 Tax=Scytonema hofmannii PCC 7110 TaxID=128403 RepID=A0A139X3J8_9CYAN|nr:hypothetical protein WA1_31310 [Scytonema hofmannii PCC 7110]
MPNTARFANGIEIPTSVLPSNFFLRIIFFSNKDLQQTNPAIAQFQYWQLSHSPLAYRRRFEQTWDSLFALLNYLIRNNGGAAALHP